MHSLAFATSQIVTIDVYNPPVKWTVLSKHAWYQNHKIFVKVTIVNRNNIYKKQLILEMTHIASNPHAENQ